MEKSKEDFRSRLPVIETGRSKAETTVLTRKLGTGYATSGMSHKLCVPVNSSIVICYNIDDNDSAIPQVVRDIIISFLLEYG